MKKEKITLERIFHPIGQGAFYTEKFKTDKKNIANIVYDCGTVSNQETLREEINETFEEEEVIDILFLSHLHADHTSGVEYLKQRCKIKNVILPIVNEFEKLIVKLDLILNKVNIDILNPEEFFDKETKIIYVRPSDGEEQFNSVILNTDELTNNSSIASGAKIIINALACWSYTPFNLRNETQLNDFKNELIVREIDIEKLSDIDYFEENKSILFYCYGDQNGPKHNKNSLLIYSCSHEYSKLEILSNMLENSTFKSCRTTCVACLYTGDADLTIENLVDRISNTVKNYMEQTAILQIPHHGSRKNFNKNAFKLIPQNFGPCIISARSQNDRHPNKELLGEILYHGGFPTLITEKPDTKTLHNVSFSFFD